MQDAAIGGLWIVCSNAGSMTHTQVLKKPGLCQDQAFVISLLSMDLPAIENIQYREPNHLVFGSFNHTRKLTRYLSSVLVQFCAKIRMQFASFLVILFMMLLFDVIFSIRLQDKGIAPHQLATLPLCPNIEGSYYGLQPSFLAHSIFILR